MNNFKHFVAILDMFKCCLEEIPILYPARSCTVGGHRGAEAK